jgi:hypothetical protein
LGLREQINEKPGLSSGAIGVVIVLILVFIVWQFRGNRPPPPPPPGQDYFTADDGHSWFSDTGDKILPYEHNGAMAVRCHVFKCASGAPFAGYLETYTQILHDQLTGITKVDSQHQPVSRSSDTLVKRPGDKNWVPSYSPEGRTITDVRCPNGQSDRPQPVSP